MQERYLRNIPALSEEECTLMQTKKIVIAGCGGLGGHLAELMTRIGCGEIVLIDGDVFEPTNLNRQLLSDQTCIGCSKSAIAAERLSRINSEIKISHHDVYLTEENVDTLLSGADAVLDGLDSIAARKIVKRACSRAGIPYIYGAIAGWVSQAAISMPEDNLIELLYPEHTLISDKSALSFTPALCAAMQIALCVKLLTGRPVTTGTVYYFDLLHQEYEAIPIVAG